MTDLEKFQALCKEFGLTPAITNDETCTLTFEKSQPKVVGLPHSLAEFVFNPDGSFNHVGVWE